MAEPRAPDSVDLTQWLREVGRRRIRIRPAARAPAKPVPSAQPATPTRARARAGIRPWPLLSLLAAFAFLQYFYADVFLQIARLPLMIVFILVHGQLPPA